MKKTTNNGSKSIGGILSVAGAVIVGVGAIITAGLFVANKYTLELSIPAEGDVTVEYGQPYDDQVTALFYGTIFHREGIPVEVEKSNEPDLTALGDYEEHYKAAYGSYESTALRRVHVVDTTPPVIELVTDPDHYTSPIASYEEEGYTATDVCDGDLTAEVASREEDGKVIYTVSDRSGNETTVIREIRYKDEVAPVITLEGESSITWEFGNEYADPGYTAADDCDGDITASVTVSGQVDVEKLGVYELVYEVQDSYGNIGQAVRSVEVIDTTAPCLTLAGDSSLYILAGNSYKEPGYSAEDNADGDLSEQVVVSGKPDTSTRGVYTISYTVSDSSGNETTAKRTVYVYRKQTAAQVQNPGDKVVYLTFDDGPCKNTQRLLDVLDEYNVKATFFVTNQFPSFQNLIGEEFRRGHTVAIHSYSHDYADIYSGEEAYYKDLLKMSDICEAQTGVAPTILRFPGGSSNSVSKKYCKGIMTSLTESVGKMGYLYADWNVLSGDAGETTSTEVVKQNIINGMQKNKVSTVLQHDLWGFSVDAVEDVIKWGLANGYTFLPLTENSPMYHHSVNN